MMNGCRCEPKVEMDEPLMNVNKREFFQGNRVLGAPFVIYVH